MQYSDLPDERLAAEAAEDRQGAFAALYDRYLPVLYDLARRLLRSSDEAIESCRAVFATAHQALDQHGPPTIPVRSWLFSLLHREVTTTLRRAPQIPDETDEALAAIPSSPPGQETALDAEYREIAQMVWQSVRELRPEDRELVLLHIRDGLDASEIAEVLGRRREQTQAALVQGRVMFEAIVTALIVLEKGRRACQELDDLAYGFQHSPRLLDQVAEHATTCVRCQQTRNRYVSGSEVLAGLLPVSVPAGASGAIWRQVMEGPAPAAGVTTALPIPGAALGWAARIRDQLPWWRLQTVHPAVLGIVVFVAVTSVAFFAAYALGSRMRDNSAATPPTPQRLLNVTPTVAQPAVVVLPSPTEGSPTVTPTTTASPSDTPAPSTSTTVLGVVPTRPPAPPTETDTPRPAATATPAATPTEIVPTAPPPSPSATDAPPVTAPVTVLVTPATPSIVGPSPAATDTSATALPTGALPPLIAPTGPSPTGVPGTLATLPPAPTVPALSPSLPQVATATFLPALPSFTLVPTATAAPEQVVPTLPVIIIAPAGTATSTPSGP